MSHARQAVCLLGRSQKEKTPRRDEEGSGGEARGNGLGTRGYPSGSGYYRRKGAIPERISKARQVRKRIHDSLLLKQMPGCRRGNLRDGRWRVQTAVPARVRGEEKKSGGKGYGENPSVEEKQEISVLSVFNE